MPRPASTAGRGAVQVLALEQPRHRMLDRGAPGRRVELVASAGRRAGGPSRTAARAPRVRPVAPRSGSGRAPIASSDPSASSAPRSRTPSATASADLTAASSSSRSSRGARRSASPAVVSTFGASPRARLRLDRRDSGGAGSRYSVSALARSRRVMMPRSIRISPTEAARPALHLERGLQLRARDEPALDRTPRRSGGDSHRRRRRDRCCRPRLSYRQQAVRG